jgi:glutathione synthase/RimK-type ligase-like ATP-grasp enzyme
LILILTGEGDPHAEAVEACLRRRGAAFTRFDPAWYPDRARLSIGIDRTGTLDGELSFDGQRLALADLGAVWVRRPGRPATASASLGPAAAHVVTLDAGAAMADLWELLECRVVPGSPDAIAHAAHKGRQLLSAARLGFDVPTTVTGNDPDALLDLVAATAGPVITKRVAPGQRMEAEGGVQVGRFSLVVRPRDLVHAEDLARCPITAQAYVPKALELRVTVVGEQVLTAAIDSQVSNHTRHDWRRYDHATTPVRPFALPPAVEARCRRLVRHLGLVYGAIDLVLTPDGRYVFLEINPSGQYLWIEELTGLPITDAIADVLVGAGAAPAVVGVAS